MTNTIEISKINTTEQILDRDAKDIKALSKSINEFGLTTPITIDKDNNLISGFMRVEAYKLLKHTEIPYYIADCKSDYQKINLILDSNLMDKNLSKFEMSKLLSKKKEAYEKEYPTSTQSYKSKNNAKEERERVVTEKGFFEYIAEILKCSDKIVRNMVNEYESIYKENPQLALLLLEYEKTANNKLKGIDIKYISELSPDGMNKLVDDLLAKKELNENFSLKDLLLEKQDNKTTPKERNELVFILDFINLLSKDESLKSKFNDIDVDLKEAKKIKRQYKMSFTNQIKFILNSLK